MHRGVVQVFADNWQSAVCELLAPDEKVPGHPLSILRYHVPDGLTGALAIFTRENLTVNGRSFAISYGDTYRWFRANDAAWVDRFFSACGSTIAIEPESTAHKLAPINPEPELAVESASKSTAHKSAPVNPEPELAIGPKACGSTVAIEPVSESTVPRMSTTISFKPEPAIESACGSTVEVEPARESTVPRKSAFESTAHKSAPINHEPELAISPKACGSTVAIEPAC
ncbi:MAG: hypothetical protein AAFQ99_13770, partial [Pseudomonadota bacterium]